MGGTRKDAALADGEIEIRQADRRLPYQAGGVADLLLVANARQLTAAWVGKPSDVSSISPSDADPDLDADVTLALQTLLA